MHAAASPSPAVRIDYATTLAPRDKAVILVGVLLGLFLAALDQTIVATALPRILQDLQGLSLLPWLTAAYLLASTTMVPIYGRLSDLYGRKRVLLVGIVTFVTGSMLCGVAQSMAALVAFRALQGIGAAALTSTAFAITADLFVAHERARYQGVFSGVFGLASVIGPWLGGWLTDTVGWRWVFYVNVPLGALALAFVVVKMPRLHSGLAATVDWLGAALFVTTVVPLLIALTLDKGLYPWSSPTVVGLLGGAVLALGVFLWVEVHQPSPMMPLALFRQRQVTMVLAVSFFIGAVFLSSIIYMSLFTVHVLGVSAAAAGSALVPLTLSMTASAFACAAVCQRLQRFKPVVVGGLVMVLLACVALAGMDETTTMMGVRLRMVLFGLGMGPIMPILTFIIQNLVPPQYIGAATAGRQFFQQLGGAIGSAVLGAILTNRLTVGLATHGPRHAYGDAVAGLYLDSIVPALIALLLMLAVPEIRLRLPNAAPPDAVSHGVGALS